MTTSFWMYSRLWVLIGSRDQRILENKHDTLSTYGLLSDYSKRVVRDWIEQLCGQNYIAKTGEYHVLSVTEKGWRVLKGTEKPRLLQPSDKKPVTSKAEIDSWQGVDRGLLETLRAHRALIAHNKGAPAFVIFGDASLRDMARRRPSHPIDYLRNRPLKNTLVNLSLKIPITRQCRIKVRLTSLGTR